MKNGILLNAEQCEKTMHIDDIKAIERVLIKELPIEEGGMQND